MFVTHLLWLPAFVKGICFIEVSEAIIHITSLSLLVRNEQFHSLNTTATLPPQISILADRSAGLEVKRNREKEKKEKQKAMQWPSPSLSQLLPFLPSASLRWWWAKPFSPGSCFVLLGDAAGSQLSLCTKWCFVRIVLLLCLFYLNTSQDWGMLIIFLLAAKLIIFESF